MDIVIKHEDLMDTRFTSYDVIILSILKNKGRRMKISEINKHVKIQKNTRARSLKRLEFLKEIKIQDRMVTAINISNN